ncbi:pyridoxamine 5'-phosphate oxidase family protein [Halodesulfurarchaeum sp. HSR-GB]|uniref:pyridoxamine 5'-phosphate oxidase family protein n=1 Tax=Halodesulfurarchaeum sp. HSR-GB TaxID=3074077 RepID=UPI002859F295|nr:pyridoxamine 5'-phosphate oxidase family protein [Halodesulfurarchaeum sp. HSR-GB]MDR5655738.1 pyridoxamine 5'-phosphate oxidase family protein [Halodesulfurarchaeum sp. HSR-GB]
MSDQVPDEAERLLESEPLAGFLATSVEDKPHVAPLWYQYADGVIELTTTGRKLANIRENPRVSLAVQKADAGTPEWMVTLLGTAEIVEDAAEERRVRREINAKYGAEPDAFSENTLVKIDVGTASYTVY